MFPECTGTCRLADQVFIGRDPVAAGGGASLSGCRLCGALHVFTSTPAGQQQVTPMNDAVAAARFGIPVEAIRTMLKAVSASSPVDTGLWVASFSVDAGQARVIGDTDCFDVQDGVLQVTNRRVGVGQRWSCWMPGQQAVPIRQRVRACFRFSVGEQPVRLFALGVGSGEDFASESVTGHFLQIYGDAVWTVAKGPEARCVPMQMSIRSGVIYRAEFVVSEAESRLRFQAEAGAPGEGFEHRISTAGWDAWQPMLLALSSDQVPDAPGHLRLIELKGSQV